MTQNRKKWYQVSIRGLLLLTFIAAVFLGGYRLGYQSGRNAYFDDLIELITTTIDPDSGGTFIESEFIENSDMSVVEDEETSGDTSKSNGSLDENKPKSK